MTASILFMVGAGVIAYFLTIFLTGLYVIWCQWEQRQNVEANERLAFERHAAKELRDHLRVVGGNRISSHERWPTV